MRVGFFQKLGDSGFFEVFFQIDFHCGSYMGLQASRTPQRAEKHEISEKFSDKKFWGGWGSPTPKLLYGIPKGSIGLLRGGFFVKKKFRETSKKWAAYGIWTPQVRPICPLPKNGSIRKIRGHSLYGQRLKK